MQRIGLFGGSFNPVHLGHLLVAQAACEECQLERLFFIPAAQSPFKPDLPLAAASERLRLLRLALAGQSQCVVDDQEVVRGGISYSIETIRDYARRMPEARFSYLIGADHVRQLPKWRESQQLAALVEFLVIPRPGEDLAPLPEPFRGRPLKDFTLAVSSSQIRERIRAGLSIAGLVPAAVVEAIKNNRLYL